MKKLIWSIPLVLFTVILGYGQGLPQVIIETAEGSIYIDIDTLNAPVTAKNFLMHVRAGRYKGAAFYRVVRMDNQVADKVKIEVIQGGIDLGGHYGKIRPISHETTRQTGLKHLDGTISMARNEPGSASTEFFICIGPQPSLDFGGNRNPDGQGFAAFGQVVRGMETVQAIQAKKDKGQMLLEAIPIIKVEIVGSKGDDVNE